MSTDSSQNDSSAAGMARELEQTRAALQSLIHSAHFGVHRFELADDGALIFVDANETAGRMFSIDDAPLRGTTIEWWRKMRELISETRVTFNHQEGQIDVAPLGLGGLSPHMLAIDLVGEDFYWWMLEYPQQCHRFLAKITQGEIDAENLARQVDPRPRGNIFGLAEDSAQIMSA